MAVSKRTAHLAAHQFKPGQSGNPKGRKKGCRPVLCESFLESLLRFWKERGDDLLIRAMEENPAALVAVVARLLPKDFELTVAGAIQTAPELSPEQRQRIAEAWMLSQQARPAIDVEAVRDNPAQGENQSALPGDLPAKIKPS